VTYWWVYFVRLMCDVMFVICCGLGKLLFCRVIGLVYFLNRSIDVGCCYCFGFGCYCGGGCVVCLYCWCDCWYGVFWVV